MITSAYFFGILIVSAAIYWLLPKQNLRTLFLTIASLGFISLYDTLAVLLIVLLSAFTFAAAGLIERRSNKKLFHRLGITGLLVVLGIFKYAGFFTATISSLAEFMADLPAFHFDKLLLPLGVSYIVLKYLSFLTDVYWGLVRRGDFKDFLLYGSLFTIYVAGPIERYETFRPQIAVKQNFRVSFVEVAFQRIVFGLFKKMVLADWIGYFIDPIWQNLGAQAWEIRILALLGYSLQIYFDFSGYSDIAVGASRLFGVTVRENFDWPYLQPDIGKFWRHWHISLSDWIRDYLFFPLSRMSEKRMWRTVGVPMAAMALCGLWHGAAWHFVIWGLWHGAGLALLQNWRGRKLLPGGSSIRTADRLRTVFATVSTFAFVTIGWLWFR